jgi:hypothetical protein
MKHFNHRPLNIDQIQNIVIVIGSCLNNAGISYKYLGVFNYTGNVTLAFPSNEDVENFFAITELPPRSVMDPFVQIACHEIGIHHSQVIEFASDELPGVCAALHRIAASRAEGLN